MKSERILYALGRVKESYIEEAAPGRKQPKKHHFRWAAAIAAVLLGVLFLQTAPGAAAAEMILEQVTSLIETLFPPKEVTVAPEGEIMEIPHIAGGQEPETQADGSTGIPGFGIYYDPETYVMVEENDATYIRPIFFSEDLPACEIEIRHLTDTSTMDAAEDARASIPSDWTISSIENNLTSPAGLRFSASGGNQWNSLQEDLYFVDDGSQGVFQITLRYFLEATEGHGVRFWAMVETFTVIDP